MQKFIIYIYIYDYSIAEPISTRAAHLSACSLRTQQALPSGFFLRACGSATLRTRTPFPREADARGSPAFPRTHVPAFLPVFLSPRKKQNEINIMHQRL